jgi:mitogen-activated protein kinase 7
MLAFDPTSRVSVEVALDHRYLQIWHDAQDEPSCPTPFDFSFEVVDDIPQMRQMILNEVIRFRHTVRRQPVPPTATIDIAGLQRKDSVGIPDHQWAQKQRNDLPRPHEAQHPEAGLEQELAGGLDVMHQ